MLTTVLVAAASCSDNMEYTDVTPNPVTAFYEPANEKAVKLVASNSASLLFEWEPSHAADGALPQYELAFYKSDDTTNPIYKITSDNAGIKPMATVSHKDLTKVMVAAGVPMGDKGTVKWGVLTYTGAIARPSTILYDITITRFVGFDVIPDELYLTGAGSETGADLSQAYAMMKPTSESFEIFTKLTAGQKIYFADSRDGATTYSINGTRLVEGEDGGTTAPSDGVYRISLDFSTANASLKKIEHLYFRFTDFDGFSTVATDNHVCFEYDYAGNGVFRKEATVVTKDTGWSWDPFESRYNLLMVYEGDEEATWAPTNTGLDSKPSSLDINSDYFNMQEFSGKVGYKWKIADAWYNTPCVFSAYFNNEYGTFKHFQEVK